MLTGDDNVNKLPLIILLVTIAVVIGGASAIDFTGWKQVEINESLTNSSSTTVYTVMVPPGTTQTTQDSNFGPTTILANETAKNSSYAIYVMDNPTGQKLTNETAKFFLDNFMIGAGITPLANEPIVLSDGIAMYGTQGNNTAGVYVLSTDQKVSIIVGFYGTMDDAIAGVENLAMIAGTIEIKPVV